MDHSMRRIAIVAVVALGCVGATQIAVDREGYVQFRNTCVADDGTAAWTTIAGQSWKGYVRAPGGTTIRLD